MLFCLESNDLWVVGVMLAAAGGVMMGFGIRALYRIVASRHWPTVQGKIIFSLVETQREQTSEGGRRVTYVPRIKYEYEVEGRRCTAEGVGFGVMTVGFGLGSMFFSAERRVRKLVDRYPVGLPVLVYYNPRKPGIAAVERWHGVVGMVMLMLIGSLFLLFGLRMF